MKSKTQYYVINKFIRKNESGVIDLEKSLQLVRELSAAVHFNPHQNILVDLRNTKLKKGMQEKLMEVVMESLNYNPLLLTSR